MEQTSPPSAQSNNGSASPHKPEAELLGWTPGLLEIQAQLRSLPLFREAVALQRLQALEFAEQAGSPEAAWAYLRVATALGWLLAPQFEMKLRDIAHLRTSLDNPALDRLVTGEPGATSSNAGSSVDGAPPGLTDSMPYDSDSDPTWTEHIFSRSPNSNSNPRGSQQ